MLSSPHISFLSLVAYAYVTNLGCVVSQFTMASSGDSHESLTDEEIRKLLKPHPTIEEAREAFQKGYAKVDQIVTIVRELDSYDDKNYLVDISGTLYLGKVHNGCESKDFLDHLDKKQYEKSIIHLQNAMIECLSQHGISTSTPQPSNDENIPTPAIIHPLPVVSKDHSPCPLVVRLLRWVPGKPMSTVEVLPIETLADAGRVLGRVSQALSNLPTDKLLAAKRYHQWDGKNTIHLRSFIQHIPDQRRQSIITSIVDAFQREIVDSGVSDSFPIGMLHGDYNDANILVDNELRISGVLDFGDSVER